MGKKIQILVIDTSEFEFDICHGVNDIGFSILKTQDYKCFMLTLSQMP